VSKREREYTQRKRPKSDIPPWVVSALTAWGKAKRRVWLGHDPHTGHEDGYGASLLGRIGVEREAAGAGQQYRQRWPEVYRGDALAVQRAVHGMPLRYHAVLHLHYVFAKQCECPLAEKLAYLECERATYYQLLQRAQVWIHAILDSGSEPNIDPILPVVKEIAQRIREQMANVPPSIYKAKFAEALESQVVPLGAALLRLR